MIFALAMGLSCLMVVGEAPRFEAPDVHEVEAAPERFVDRPLRVTGRFLSAAGRRLRLIGSQIEFELDPDVRIHANPRQIEVVGTLSRDGERCDFGCSRCSSLQQKSSGSQDAERVFPKSITATCIS
jgi:hypothetical protein